MRAPSFWHSPNLLATLLSPLSCLYAMTVKWRQARIMPWTSPVPVICVGNAVAGGAGKTPLVLLLHQHFRAQGIEAHIVSRGYKGKLPGPLKVDRAKHTAVEVGDEALLIAHHAPCWVSKNRRLGIEAAARQGAHIVLLDDGLQNPSVEKTFSFLVMDGEYGLGNGHVIPAGPLRETLQEALARSHAVIVVGEDRHNVTSRVNNMPVLQAAIRPSHPEHAGGNRYIAFAGIGRPEKFFATLRMIGADVLESVPYADHHLFSEAELKGLAEKARMRQALLITTEKDFFRLPKEWQKHVKTLPVGMVMEDQAAFEKMLAPLVAESKMRSSR